MHGDDGSSRDALHAHADVAAVSFVGSTQFRARSTKPRRQALLGARRRREMLEADMD
ncbi:hypothetical protein [Bradyrhizobium sp. 45]|uniref:hypothetical protein n=1 Tax=Bradyrhizobium sp. 45 TaxID=1043587 RepID=UPI001FF9BA3B